MKTNSKFFKSRIIIVLLSLEKMCKTKGENFYFISKLPYKIASKLQSIIICRVK